VLQYDVACSTKHPVSYGVQVLAKVLQDMELRRPLYYFTAVGMVRVGIGTFMGIILHSMSMMIRDITSIEQLQ
jgi:hypothetical protein